MTDGRKDDEIKVTPEMIEAGLVHLYRYHPERGVSDEDTVIAIFKAMNKAREHKPHSTDAE